MEEIALDVQVRSAKGTMAAKKSRREGRTPAVLYGEEKESIPISFDNSIYQKIFRMHKGENLIFHLNVKEGDKVVEEDAAIVKDQQRHPVSDDIIHVDFQRISLKNEIEVNVPLVVKGESIGVKTENGVLDHVMWSLDILCLPTNIPQKIDVDVSNLHKGESIHIKDLTLPEGVKTKHNVEDVVVAVTVRMQEEPEEGEEQEEPEVLKEKKKEE